jgi:hypothetical protein
MSKSVLTKWSRVKLGDLLTTLTDYHANGSYSGVSKP